MIFREDGDLKKQDPPPPSLTMAFALCCQPSCFDTNRSLGPSLDSPLRFWPKAERSKTHREQWWPRGSFCFRRWTSTPAHTVSHSQLTDPLGDPHHTSQIHNKTRLPAIENISKPLYGWITSFWYLQYIWSSLVEPNVKRLDSGNCSFWQIKTFFDCKKICCWLSGG